MRETAIGATMPYLDIQPASFTDQTTASGAHLSAGRRPRRKPGTWLALALAVALAGVAGGVIGASTSGDPAPVVLDQTGTGSIVAAQQAIDLAASPNLDAVAIGDAVIPSIVTVEIGSNANGSFAKIGSGSGVVYDTAGHIVTNDHVAGAASAARVVLSDGRIYDADLVGTDPLTDLAVLHISATGLQPITIGSTAGLDVGSPAIAVGSPLGLDGGPSLSVGVISALGRQVQTDAETILYGMLQTDAPITSGSSGGSLVDEGGALIGITTAVGVSNIGVEGIGFATPVEVVQRVADEIIATGSATHALIGITGTTAYEPTDDGGVMPIGVTVMSVLSDSPAAAAGLVEGDVITGIEGVPVATMDALITELRRTGATRPLELSLADRGPITIVPTTLEGS